MILHVWSFCFISASIAAIRFLLHQHPYCNPLRLQYVYPQAVKLSNIYRSWRSLTMKTNVAAVGDKTM